MSAAIERAKEVNAQLVLGTDPDADRVGIAVPDAKTEGGWRLLNGNETGALLVDYVVSGRAANGKLQPGYDFVAKTIVTSDLMAVIGASAGLDVHLIFMKATFWRSCTSCNQRAPTSKCRILPTPRLSRMARSFSGRAL